MKFVGMIAIMPLEPARLFVRRVVIHAVSHQVTLVELVKEDESSFIFVDVVIDPDFAARDIFVHVLVAAFREFDVVHAADKAALHEPDLYAVGKWFPEIRMNFRGVGQRFAANDSSEVSRRDTQPALLAVGRAAGRIVVGAVTHQSALQHGVMNEEPLFVLIRFLIDPDLVLRYFG